MTKGTVKWFNTVQGYGFIAPDDGAKDAFVHIAAVEKAGLTGLRRARCSNRAYPLDAYTRTRDRLCAYNG